MTIPPNVIAPLLETLLADLLLIRLTSEEGRDVEIFQVFALDVGAIERVRIALGVAQVRWLVKAAVVATGGCSRDYWIVVDHNIGFACLA